MTDGAFGSGTTPGVTEDVETDRRTALARPWNVIVHDDPVTLMQYVVSVLRKIFGHSDAKAHELMMEVHTKGRSIVWTGPREQAEMYVFKLHASLLRATMEQVEA
ncbi:MAG: ATP-dependent Clp protease adapter ClpS [Planctomycetes bacterium]|nr:ATP-dependent Clp protease adapter ClpS [Planctomycetota bacterium]